MSEETQAGSRGRSLEVEGEGVRNVRSRLTAKEDGSGTYRLEPHFRYPSRSYFEVRIRSFKRDWYIATSLQGHEPPGVHVVAEGNHVDMVVANDSENRGKSSMDFELLARPFSREDKQECTPIRLLVCGFHGSSPTLWYRADSGLQLLTLDSPVTKWKTDFFQSEGGIYVKISVRLIPGNASDELYYKVPNDDFSAEAGRFDGAASQRVVEELGGAGGSSPPSGAAADKDGQKDCLDCVVCMSTKSSVCLLPCKHLCVCQGCHDALSERSTRETPYKCPICRRKVHVRRCTVANSLV